MTRGFKDKVKLVEVKPVSEDDADHILTYEESNHNASSGNRNRKSFKFNLLQKVEKDHRPSCADGNRPLAQINKDKTNIVQDLIKDIKSTEEISSQVLNEIDKQVGGIQTSAVQISGKGTEDMNIQCEDQINLKTKKRKKKKAKKKRKKDQGKECDTKPEPECQKTDEEPTQTENDNAESETNANNGRKLPCLLGFVSTWLAKRKEKRRAKKRKAMESRTPSPLQPLVEYEHRKAKGGVAFTVEVDNRPMRKPVLPPIKQRHGPIVREIDEKLNRAEVKRTEELAKKKQSSKEHDKRKTEYQCRKADKEFYFKQKVDLTIKHKQSGAKKNRARFLEDRHCSTPLLRAPSTLPPLRNARVKLIAVAEQNGTADPDDEIFNF